jgi:hypothetical protein
VDTPRARKYTAKPLKLTADADFDLVLSQPTGSISWTSTDSGTDLSNFFPQNNEYIPKVILRNYGETNSVTLPSAAVTLDYDAETLDFTIPYTSAKTALGLVDPGTWTLYASSTDGEGVESLVELATGNLKVTMY